MKESEKPFFAYVASKLPHDYPPPMVPEHYRKPYLEAGLSEGDASVYGMIANLDHNVGRMLAMLEEEGLAENTLVIFFPDNGALRPCPDLKTPYESEVVREYNYTERYNMGLRGGKTLAYEGGIHVPCFVRWLGHFTADREIDALTAHVDWLPTLLEIAGTKPPADISLDGRSLISLLTGASDHWNDDRTLVFQSDRVEVPRSWANACVRGERFKLVNRNELYDLSVDQAEAHNVAEQYAGIVKQYRAIYDRWYTEVVCETDGFEPSYAVIGSDEQWVTSFNTAELHSVKGQPADNGWRIRVARSGEYKINVSGVHPDWFGPEGALVFQFGDNSCRLPVKPGAESLEGSIQMDAETGYFTLMSYQLEGGHMQLRGIQVHPGFDKLSLQYIGK
jgi:arylsulfatase B